MKTQPTMLQGILKRNPFQPAPGIDDCPFDQSQRETEAQRNSLADIFLPNELRSCLPPTIKNGLELGVGQECVTGYKY